MAANYLGQFPVEVAATPFADYTAADWCLEFIQEYGSIDGEHHKTWVMDQVARILRGTEMVVEEARWGPSKELPNGLVEYRYWTSYPSKAYFDWVKKCRGWDEETQEYDHDYDEGIAP